MKYIKTYEKLGDKLEIGDYVKLDYESMKWVDAGLYGIVPDTIFQIKNIDRQDYENHYYLNIINDWFSDECIIKASDLEVAQMKYNL